jgi:diguanylate cyclase (GGDEF)-like protein
VIRSVLTAVSLILAKLSVPARKEFTMAQQRSKLFSHPGASAVALPTLRRLPGANPDGTVATAAEGGALRTGAVQAGAAPTDAFDSVQCELKALRAINASLRRELAALQLREAEALRLADRDGLTGLYNRRRMFELLDAAIADAARQVEHVGLLFIDLNGFKAVNDFHGHAAGDRILTTVAARMSATVRTGDIVCRYGGDEFVVVLPSLPDEGCLAQIAEGMAERIALPYWISGQEQHLSASVGMSLYPRDGGDAEALLHRADENMYEGKIDAAYPPRNGTPENDRRQRFRRRRNDKL